MKALGFPRILIPPARLLGCLALGAVVFSACQPAKKGEGRAHDPVGEDPATRQVVVLTWADYIVPDLLTEFHKQTGIKVVYETIKSSGQFEAELQSRPGAYDVIICDDNSLMDLIRLGLVEQINREELRNFPNLDPIFLNRDFDPGNRFTVPYLWGTYAVAYRKDLVSEEPEHSWNLLWDDRLRGHITLIDEPIDLLNIALRSLGTRPEVAGTPQFEAASARLVRQITEDRAEMKELYEGIHALTEGRTSVLVTFSGDAVNSLRENDKIGIFVPKEGSPLWLDSFAVCRNSTRMADAHRFIDFMLSAHAAGETTNFLKTATPNLVAKEEVKPELARDEILYPDADLLSRCGFTRFEGDRRTLMDRGLRPFYDALREKQSRTRQADEPPPRADGEKAGLAPVARPPVAAASSRIE